MLTKTEDLSIEQAGIINKIIKCLGEYQANEGTVGLINNISAKVANEALGSSVVFYRFLLQHLSSSRLKPPKYLTGKITDEFISLFRKEYKNNKSQILKALEDFWQGMFIEENGQVLLKQQFKQYPAKNFEQSIDLIIDHLLSNIKSIVDETIDDIKKMKDPSKALQLHTDNELASKIKIFHLHDADDSLTSSESSEDGSKVADNQSPREAVIQKKISYFIDLIKKELPKEIHFTYDRYSICVNVEKMFILELFESHHLREVNAKQAVEILTSDSPQTKNNTVTIFYDPFVKEKIVISFDMKGGRQRQRFFRDDRSNNVFNDLNKLFSERIEECIRLIIRNNNFYEQLCREINECIIQSWSDTSLLSKKELASELECSAKIFMAEVGNQPILLHEFPTVYLNYIRWEIEKNYRDHFVKILEKNRETLAKFIRADVGARDLNNVKSDFEASSNNDRSHKSFMLLARVIEDVTKQKVFQLYEKYRHRIYGIATNILVSQHKANIIVSNHKEVVNQFFKTYLPLDVLTTIEYRSKEHFKTSTMDVKPLIEGLRIRGRQVLEELQRQIGDESFTSRLLTLKKDIQFIDRKIQSIIEVNYDTTSFEVNRRCTEITERYDSYQQIPGSEKVLQSITALISFLNEHLNQKREIYMQTFEELVIMVNDSINALVSNLQEESLQNKIDNLRKEIQQISKSFNQFFDKKKNQKAIERAGIIQDMSDKASALSKQAKICLNAMADIIKLEDVEQLKQVELFNILKTIYNELPSYRDFIRGACKKLPDDIAMAKNVYNTLSNLVSATKCALTIIKLQKNPPTYDQLSSEFVVKKSAVPEEESAANEMLLENMGKIIASIQTALNGSIYEFVLSIDSAFEGIGQMFNPNNLDFEDDLHQHAIKVGKGFVDNIREELDILQSMSTHQAVSDVELKALETLSNRIGKILNISSSNIVIPVAIFCINEQIDHNKGKRHFISVPLEGIWNYNGHQHLLLTPAEEDGIFAGHQAAFAEEITREEDVFFTAITNQIHQFDRTKLYNSADVNNAKKITAQSERVFTAALRKPDVVKQIVKNLEKEFTSDSNKDKTDGVQGKHKVYAVTLLLHSTNTVCEHCTRALIAQLNDKDPQGFLAQLDEELNKSSYFSTYNSKGMKNLRRSTIVVSEDIYARDEHALLHRRFSPFELLRQQVFGSLNIKALSNLSFVELVNPLMNKEVSSISFTAFASSDFSQKGRGKIGTEAKNAVITRVHQLALTRALEKVNTDQLFIV